MRIGIDDGIQINLFHKLTVGNYYLRKAYFKIRKHLVLPTMPAPDHKANCAAFRYYVGFHLYIADIQIVLPHVLKKTPNT